MAQARAPGAGSFADALSGVALLASAFFLFAGKPLGALIYAGILAFWIVMSILEAGLDFIALLPRLAAWAVVGLWFLSPWHRAAMGKTAENRINAVVLFVGIATAAAALLLVGGAFQTDPVVEGTKNAAASGTPVTDWRNYGGVPGGQRFAQIDQINVSNVSKLEKAWSSAPAVATTSSRPEQTAELGMVDLGTGRQHADRGRRFGHRRRNPATRRRRMCRAVVEPRPPPSPAPAAALAITQAPATYTGECAKRIITGTVDARLLAVDAMDWPHLLFRKSFGFSGAVNLVSGLGYSPLGNFMVTLDAPCGGRQDRGRRSGDRQPADRQPLWRVARLRRCHGPGSPGRGTWAMRAITACLTKVANTRAARRTCGRTRPMIRF